MKVSTVLGHAGKWVLGKLKGTPLAVMSGRLHYYEGFDLKDVVFPVHVMKVMGIDTLILTNAAGAVNAGYKPGDLMFITDHINLTGANPLFGANEEAFGTRFPDMSYAYDKKLLDLAEDCAKAVGVSAHQGVYSWMTGPSFETPAEIRMLRILGGDAVGMSTVPEVLCAVHAGMRVLGVSCLSNMAAGILDQPLTHQEVIKTMEQARPGISRFLSELIGRL
jgi:purine-nucleoside phosphorylase